MLGHIQSGNIFVVDDVCQLGGYENTLLGYKTRLFMRCKDHLDSLDTIPFGESNSHIKQDHSSGFLVKDCQRSRFLSEVSFNCQ